MDAYLTTLFVIGVAALGMAWLPKLLKNGPISYAMVYLFLGFGLYALPFDLPLPRLREDAILRVTELSVIITLMGTGLKIDEKFRLSGWRVPLLLVAVTMPLSILVVAVWAGWGLGWPLASAVLLAAVLAPTDPVLAGDVQVGPPRGREREDDEVRFSLTAEAGLNDGTAFPFTWLAIGMAGVAVLAVAPADLSTLGEVPWTKWLLRDVLQRIVIGTVAGLLMGRGLAWVVFDLPNARRLPRTRDSLVAVAATLGVYGLTELLQGYGFIAVFVTGLVFGRYERNHEYHQEMHDFIEQIERLFLVFILMLLGGGIARGLFSSLSWPRVGLAVGFLLVIRPLTGWLATLGSDLNRNERLAVGFFGIRGVGSFFYLAYAINKKDFQHEDELWATVGLIVVISVIVHGLTVTPVMRRLERQKQRGDPPPKP
ncbi:MAG: sodium:proton antiporter [Catalinimonas sp.]